MSARTSALFFGLPGRAYRAIVIGSGGHRVVVRRMPARMVPEAEGLL